MMPRARLLPLGFALAAVSCGPASQGLKPITVQDSGVPCPGGQIVWNLEISDQRARTSDSDHLQALLRESLAKSLPGCKWSSPASRDAPTIVIEVHRFGADFDGAIWDAGAEWSVLVRDPSGRSLTEFQVDARTSRPNYRGSDNEREALRAAFEEAVTRTVTGLRNLASGG
jgi:hypothetical protein